MSQDLKLTITQELSNKLHYFLKSHPGREWSGPAWFSYEKDEQGFPQHIVMEYFHPLHLGTTSETDWDGKDLMKIFKSLKKKYPKMGKEWIQGNVHSHHGMGAFFSSTDEQQLIDGANKNFYCSLVVSTKPGKEFAFAFSYPDQFNKIHIHEVENINVLSKLVSNKEWDKQNDFIVQKNKKEEKKSWNWKSNGHQMNQLNLLNMPTIEKERPTELEVSQYDREYARFCEVQQEIDLGLKSLKQAQRQLKKEKLDDWIEDLTDIEGYDYNTF